MASTRSPDLALVDVAGDVCLADDAHGVVAIDHRETTHLVLLHGPQGLVDRIVSTDGHRLALGELTRLDLLWIVALGDAPHHDVAIGHHPLEPVVFTADRQGSDIEIAHHSRRIGRQRAANAMFDGRGGELWPATIVSHVVDAHHLLGPGCGQARAVAGLVLDLVELDGVLVGAGRRRCSAALDDRHARAGTVRQQ